MELVVLLKAVPRSETVRYDPALRRLVREGVELVLNPFDQRALRVGLELRRRSEHLTAVLLGPPVARPLLREARALGADRALHLCDPAFVGSDLLGTSAALGVALRGLGPALVLAGAWSTDGATGLLAPEVAARLGMPVVTLARAVRRRDDPAWIEADVETRRGWRTVGAAPPLLLTVGEKIAKPLAVTPEQFARSPESGVETVGAAELGLGATEVGSFGSPTAVESFREVAPSRLGRTFGEGPIPLRVRAALEVLSPLLGPRPSARLPLPWPPAPDPDREVVVLTTDRAGATEPGALAVLTFLRRALPAYRVCAASYGPMPTPDETARVQGAGALGGYHLDPGTARFDSADVAEGLAALLEHRPRLEALAVFDSPFGREVAGQLAAPRSLGAVAGAIGVRPAPDGRLEWSKPSFAGRTVATVRCRSRPAIVTVPCGLTTPAPDTDPDRTFPWAPVVPPPPRGRVVETAAQDEPFDTPEPDEAEILVAVGSGIGGPERIAGLLPLARRWGAAVVATRRVVDAGWVPVRRQVGLTGRLLAPRLAVLLGVRGAPNHMVGWARAAAVLAVNRDPDAPVFRLADAGVVGSVEEVVEELAGPLERLVGPSPPP